VAARDERRQAAVAVRMLRRNARASTQRSSEHGRAAQSSLLSLFEDFFFFLDFLSDSDSESSSYLELFFLESRSSSESESLAFFFFFFFESRSSSLSSSYLELFFLLRRSSSSSLSSRFLELFFFLRSS